MTTARVLAVWLTPVAWLAVPTLVVDGGPDGLWAGLLFAVAPLFILRSGGGARAVPGGRDTLFPVVVLLLVLGGLALFAFRAATNFPPVVDAIASSLTPLVKYP